MFAKVLGSLDLVVHVKNMCWLIPTEKLRALPLNLVFARARIEETYWWVEKNSTIGIGSVTRMLSAELSVKHCTVFHTVEFFGLTS